MLSGERVAGQTYADVTDTRNPGPWISIAVWLGRGTETVGDRGTGVEVQLEYRSLTPHLDST